MKKLLFIFAMLVSLAFNLSAQHTRLDPLVNEFQSVRSSVKNWDSVQGSKNDKFLAIILDKPVQLQDSVVVETYRWLGTLLAKQYNYHRYLSYDGENKLFKQSVQLYQESLHRNSVDLIGAIILMMFVLPISIDLFLVGRGCFPMICIALFGGLLIFLSYYLGTFYLIAYLIYTFRYEIRARIRLLRFKKR